MKVVILMLLLGFIVYMGCTKMAPEFELDDPEQNNCEPKFPDKNVTYTNYVKNVVSKYCTESCHRGGNSPGPGNFTTYEGLKPYVGDVFYFRVIQDQADMPLGNAPLSKAMRDSLNIWVQNCGPKG